MATTTRKSSLTWRAAQAWLAGYSDALAGDSGASRPYWEPDYREDYDRGEAHGTAKANDAARTAR